MNLYIVENHCPMSKLMFLEVFCAWIANLITTIY